ncbi:MAG: hypothetical protein IK077_16705 [Thermoguttaceae bacterium]|nr:hypothetical protein [Thermoguttaceae bacterium]
MITKKLLYKYLVVISLLLVIATDSLEAAQVPLNVKTSNGYYHPGIVLLFQSGQWVPATPDNIDYSQENYVFIHGAHSKIERDKSLEIAKAILNHNSKANVLSIDWSAWSVFKEKQLDDVVVEEILKHFENVDWDDEDLDEIFENFLTDLFIRILANLIPIEQATRIPTVAERAEKILFGSKGASVALTTDGSRGVTIALGLAPGKTTLIGHSHGAHVAGLLAEKCRKNRSQTVARITALEPSPAALQASKENEDGKGWGVRSATFVDAYRISEVCCGDKLYGDLNYFFRQKEHPWLNLDNADNLFEIVDLVIDGISCDLKLHTAAVDVLIELMGTDFYWDLPDDYDEDCSRRWIIVEDE